MTEQPHPDLVALAALLVGDWRVTGPGIEGRAEYRSVRDGLVLVGHVDVRVGEMRMRNLQRITHDPGTGALLSHYLDTGGDEATYAWELSGRLLRCSLGHPGSDTYFEATVAEDGSQYAGEWHGPDIDAVAEPERIVYTLEEGGAVPQP